MARLLIARRGTSLTVEEVRDPVDDEANESGVLLPGPDAKLAGPTFEEWLGDNVVAGARSRPQLAGEQIGDLLDAAPDRTDVEVSEAEDQSRRPGLVAEAVLAERLNAHAPCPGGVDDGLFVGPRRSAHDSVEAGRQAGEPHRRGMV